jgi:hypothetical protein
MAITSLDEVGLRVRLRHESMRVRLAGSSSAAGKVEAHAGLVLARIDCERGHRTRDALGIGFVSTFGSPAEPAPLTVDFALTAGAGVAGLARGVACDKLTTADRAGHAFERTLAQLHGTARPAAGDTDRHTTPLARARHLLP